ncbi:uncharacterized protein LOC106883997 [Octopus bimaculoides]|uniref:Uncharacterized protein n=1 Tax=Octopus bimaculoides TaxID=37653 RepID=A0A0L8I5G9_OCTBM|nr:uncharacterized protein LOC106883997 [Octopus bimaculoides]|eukprot:XP_014790645.1 PREDICTED: uncharacterized protein LOC106883997 [Octopus bimaculoides]
MYTQIFFFVCCLSSLLCSISAGAPSSCTHKGVTHKHGDEWGEKCIKFGCQQGKVKLIKAACDSGAICRAIGSHWTNYCIDYTCLHKNGKLVVKKLNMRCEGHDHKCHKFGETWNDTLHGKCTVRKCVKKDHFAVTIKVSDC